MNSSLQFDTKTILEVISMNSMISTDLSGASCVNSISYRFMLRCLYAHIPTFQALTVTRHRYTSYHTYILLWQENRPSPTSQSNTPTNPALSHPPSFQKDCPDVKKSCAYLVLHSASKCIFHNICPCNTKLRVHNIPQTQSICRRQQIPKVQLRNTCVGISIRIVMHGICLALWPAPRPKSLLPHAYPVHRSCLCLDRDASTQYSVTHTNTASSPTDDAANLELGGRPHSSCSQKPTTCFFGRTPCGAGLTGVGRNGGLGWDEMKGFGKYIGLEIGRDTGE